MRTTARWPPATRVLIVEDNESDFVLTRELLEDIQDSSYEVDRARDAHSALQTLAQQEHDVYLLDHHLGASTGIELVAEFQSRGVRRPIIMLTGVGDATLDRLAMEAGASDYLVKNDVTSALLERSIRYAVETNRFINELQKAATSDELTGLANRRFFQEFLAGAMARAQRGEHKLGLLFIDLDHFKEVNGELGHDIGDRVLVEVAAQLSQCVRQGDIVSRLGGDEFAVVLDAIGDQDNAKRVSQKISSSLATHPLTINGIETPIRASIGIAIGPDDGSDAQTLIKAADTAMYAAKNSGRGHYECFRSPMHRKATRGAELHRALARSLGNDKLSLHYQPQVVAASGQIVGLEALLRWAPQGGPVSPAEFIPVAEKYDLMGDIGAWVLSTACAQHRNWRDNGVVQDDFVLAVNISAKQLSNHGLPEFIEQLLRENEMQPGSLELEITETAIASDARSAIEELRQINKLGVRIALDDFGTGYSSLNHLKRLPVQTIKIDRSFVEDATADGRNAALVTGTIALAGGMGVMTIAEGVETEAQRSYLAANGCAIMQGYLFHRPMTPTAFEDLVLTDKTRAPRFAS